jgi:flagellar L-ring protein precursor FlgH
VQIVEKISATQKSTSSIDKSGKLSASVTALPGVSPNAFNRAARRLHHHQLGRRRHHREQQRLLRHDHRGRDRRAAERPPADRRREADRRQPQRRRLRFPGQVDPRMIQTGNVVPPAQIANVRVEQRGRGAQAEAQGIGLAEPLFHQRIADLNASRRRVAA